MAAYTIYVCLECGPLGTNERGLHHNANCASRMTAAIEVVPREDLKAAEALEGRLRDELDRVRAVADAVIHAVEAELPLLREARDGRETAVDRPLAEYHASVGDPQTPVPAQPHLDQGDASRALLDEIRDEIDVANLDDLTPATLLDLMAICGLSFVRSDASANAYLAEIAVPPQ